MSESLPVAEVPESTWLRALAHALDPDVEPPEDDLVPADDAPLVPQDDPVAEVAPDDDDDLDATDVAEPAFDDPDLDETGVDEGGQLWSDPIDDLPGHDDGIG